MLYFNEKASTPKTPADTEQHRKVLQFREDLPTEGFWWTYKGTNDFERTVRGHLNKYLVRLHESKVKNPVEI
jgi:hypothetical protein